MTFNPWTGTGNMKPLSFKPLLLNLTTQELAALRKLLKTGMYGLREADVAERLIARALRACEHPTLPWCDL